MDDRRKQEIIDGMRETCRLIEHAKRLERPLHGGGKENQKARVPLKENPPNLLLNPSQFWAHRTELELRSPSDAEIAHEAGALAVRLIAADMKTGNFDRARESLVGQSLWLSALAVKLMQKADNVTLSPSSADEEAKLLKIALQAQRQAAQTLCSAAALGRTGVTVDNSAD